jgi:hypothetical protein
MNPKLKFRVWDKNQNKYLEIGVHHILSNNDGGFSIELNNDIKKISGEDCFEIEFATGLFDKRGKEIYQNDLIKTGYGEYLGSVGKIVFNFGAFMIESKYGAMFSDTYHSCLHGEVIGNINENPELL